MEELEDLALSSANIKPTPGSKHIGDPVQDNAIKVVDIIAKIEAEEQKALPIIAKIIDAINTVEDPTEHSILTLRYVKCKRWEVIAQELSYSEQRIFQIYDQALLHIKIKPD